MDVSGEVDRSTKGRTGNVRSTPHGLEYRLDQCSVVTVAVRDLAVADSPRLAGEDEEHARVLAESGAHLPPIVVHRPSMRVIDGMHRVRAAMLRGAESIAARFVECAEADVFVVAVQENIAHGLPLSVSDRKAAAERIIDSHPQWSDRVVAAATGLAANTVRSIRRRPTAHSAQSDTRIGRDGKVRPVSNAEGRARASALMVDNPTASLREIAKAAGISPETVRDVRKRLRNGENPVPDRYRLPDEGAPNRDQVKDQSSRNGNGKPRLPSAMATGHLLRELRKDPTIRFSEAGRTLLRLMEIVAINDEEWVQLVDKIPAHWVGAVACLARSCAKRWQGLAEKIEDKER